MAQLSSDRAALRKHLRLSLEIRHVDCASLQHAAAANRPAHGWGHEPNWRKDRAVVGDHRQAVALETEDRHVIRAAEPGCALDQGVEHRL